MNLKKNSKLLLIGILSLATLTGCGDKPGSKFDNENDALVFSSQECDKVFNPFFSTSAADSNVIGLTQIGMLGNSKDGKRATYGDDEPVICYDLQTVTEGSGESQTTTYYFVLKNNVKFSNGSPLTIKDVLFNYYVYLDPVYTGSSTIYSTDIVGLKEYRTQEADEKEQDSFALQFEIEAETRISALAECCDDIVDNHGTLLTKDQFRTYLEAYSSTASYSHVVEDFDKALELFKKELENDYTNAMDSYEDIIFTGESGEKYKNLFTTDVESFLYNEGYITWNKKQEKLTCSFTNDLNSIKSMSKEQAINIVYQDKVPTSVSEIITYWATASELYTYISNSAMERYYAGATRKYKNISGIKFANKDNSVTVNGKTYAKPSYNADGSVASNDHEVLSITIKKIDPKAIWNFSIGVAPMYYYSDAEHIAKFDFEENFGVEYASQTFMDTVVKDNNKIGVPVGAGPYAASKSSGGLDNVAAGDFYDKGIIYYERNPYYVMGNPVIKKIRYKVVASNQMTNALYTNDIDFVEPNSKPEIEAELEKHKSEGIDYTTIDTAGYGYIGINAGKVPSLKVRQAFMHSINTLTTVEYYKTEASAIYRSMSKVSWAYPTGCTPYYPYVGAAIPEDLSVVNPDYAAYVTKLGLRAGDVMSEKQQQQFLKDLIEEAGYSIGNGTYTKGNGDTLKYTFTIAGEETDHPAYSAMEDAGNLLNKIGCEITVSTDANALKKLSNGSLAVWAAAWGSTIDPDMYQVYHKDSTATSTKNWGYDQIKANLGGKYDTELALVEELSELIEEARETNVESQRARIYSDALDIVMQLAVELPTYQRKDLYAYNANKIDVSTLNPNPSTYDGLTNKLHQVSLLVK